MQNPVPSLDILIKLVQFNVDFWPATIAAGKQIYDNNYGEPSEYMRQWWRPAVGAYPSDTQYHLEGEYKAIYDAIGLLPAASAMNFVNKYRVDYEISKPFLQSLRDANVRKDIIDSYSKYIDEELSIKDAKELNAKLKVVKTIMRNAAVYDAIQGNESEWTDIFVGNKMIEENQNIVEGAAVMIGQMKDHALDPKKYEELIEKSKKLQELQKRKMNESELEKMNNFNKTLERKNRGEFKFKNDPSDFPQYNMFIPDSTDKRPANEKLHIRQNLLNIKH